MNYQYFLKTISLISSFIFDPSHPRSSGYPSGLLQCISVFGTGTRHILIRTPKKRRNIPQFQGITWRDVAMLAHCPLKTFMWAMKYYIGKNLRKSPRTGSSATSSPLVKPGALSLAPLTCLQSMLMLSVNTHVSSWPSVPELLNLSLASSPSDSASHSSSLSTNY